MPAQYTAIRDAYVKREMDYDKAQSIAAATFNKQHPKAPMSGAHPEGKQGRRQAILRHMKG